MTNIQLSSALRFHCGDHAAVAVDATTVAGALSALSERFPSVVPHLEAARVFLGPYDTVDLDGGDTPTADQPLRVIAPGPRSLPELTHDEIRRYSRHLILPEVGMGGQRRLKGGSVLCIGTGGLGSPLLLYLAAAGVGRIGIVDFDRVDESNLQRQVLHATPDVGRSKVQSAASRIASLNPHVQLDLYEVPLTADNALRILSGYDIVVDGTDNFPTRYLVDDACALLGIPNVYGSVYRFEGQASVFHLDGGPGYRDLYPEPPPPGLVPSCAEGGVLGVLPGIIGTIQATETLKILAGLGSTLSGRVLLYDALQMAFRELSLRRDPDRVPVTDLVDYDQLCGVPGRAAAPSAAQAYARIDVHALQQRRGAGWRPFVLDVRKPHEAAIVSLPFVDRLEPHETVHQIAAELPRDRDILVICRSGGRSAKAAATLAEQGLRRLVSLDGGLVAWATEIDPTLPTY